MYNFYRIKFCITVKMNIHREIFALKIKGISTFCPFFCLLLFKGKEIRKMLRKASNFNTLKIKTELRLKIGERSYFRTL